MIGKWDELGAPGRRLLDQEASAGPCPACGSTAGTREEMCATCGCPAPARQVRRSGQRALAFGAIGVTSRGPAVGASARR